MKSNKYNKELEIYLIERTNKIILEKYVFPVLYPCIGTVSEIKVIEIVIILILLAALSKLYNIKLYNIKLYII